MVGVPDAKIVAKIIDELLDTKTCQDLGHSSKLRHKKQDTDGADIR